MPITGFYPVDDGFKFSNSFVNHVINVPALGLDIRTLGRCGGMAFLSLDYWFNKLPIPETSILPPLSQCLQIFDKRLPFLIGELTAQQSVRAHERILHPRGRPFSVTSSALIRTRRHVCVVW